MNAPGSAGLVLPLPASRTGARSGTCAPASLERAHDCGQMRWAEVRIRLESLRPSERRTLLLLARLPLLTACATADLDGLQSVGSVYRRLYRLLQAGVVHILPTRLPAGPALTASRSGHTPDMFYLSDAGLAAVALDQGADLPALSRKNHLRRDDILSLVPGLPYLAATYSLLAALMSAGRSDGAGNADGGWPCLLALERPWRRRFVPLTASSPVSLRLPAYAAVGWGARAGGYLLVPDLATFPLTDMQRVASRLFDYRALEEQRGRGQVFPALVVATTDPGRQSAWTDLLEDARAARSDAPLRAHVTTWPALRVQPASALRGALPREDWASTPEQLIQRLCLPRRSLPAPAARVPSLVGNRVLPALAGVRFPSEIAGKKRQQAPGDPGEMLAAHVLGAMALSLTPSDRQMLDMIGRHAFLTVQQLVSILGGSAASVCGRQRRLEVLGFTRCVRSVELGDADAPLADHILLELTVPGLQVAGAQQGLTLSQAVRRNGLAGGGPERPVGQRQGLVGTLRHTVGANDVFAGLYDLARRRVSAGHDDAVLEWRGPAVCVAGRLRPDGYAVYRCDGVPFGFFLEYDRGTMKGRGYRKKFAAYYAFLEAERYRREYDACPTILVVTSDGAAEARIARAALAAGIGRAQVPRLLLTREGRLNRRGAAGLPPQHILAPIWHEPGSLGAGQPPWPLRMQA